MTTAKKLRKIKELTNLITYRLFDNSGLVDWTIGLKKIRNKVLNTKYLDTIMKEDLYEDGIMKEIERVSKLIDLYNVIYLRDDHLFKNILNFLIDLEFDLSEICPTGGSSLVFDGDNFYWNECYNLYKLKRKAYDSNR